jgi:Uma2 family endonuclease
MSQTVEKRLTFEEFTALAGEGRYELVNGRLEELVSPRPRHSWTGIRIGIELGPYLDEHDPGCFYGVELDIPTIPYFGRRPDFVYFAASAVASNLDPEEDRVTGIPTLVIEILSEGDEGRDLVTKRREYAEAGIEHYWILDPQRKTALLLALAGTVYEVIAQFADADSLTSDLFPGLQVPLSRLFR